MMELLFGFVSGVAGGMGLGGGTLLIPLFVLFAQRSPEEARLINLIAFVPAATAAVLINGKNGLMEKKTALGLLPYAVMGAFLGMLIASAVSTEMLRKGFGLLLLLLSVSQWLRAEKRNKNTPGA